MKLFKLTNPCGVAISGRAFLSETNQPAKDVGFFISRFAECEKLDGLKVKEVAERLNKSLADVFVVRGMDATQKTNRSRN
jgi:hypothetical protein